MQLTFDDKTGVELDPKERMLAVNIHAQWFEGGEPVGEAKGGQKVYGAESGEEVFAELDRLTQPPPRAYLAGDTTDESARDGDSRPGGNGEKLSDVEAPPTASGEPEPPPTEEEGPGTTATGDAETTEPPAEAPEEEEPPNPESTLGPPAETTDATGTGA